MKIPVTYELSETRIDELLESALLSGSRYWCACTEYETNIFKDGTTIVILDTEEDKKYTITRAKVEKGLKKFANSKDYSRHFADIVSENDDMYTADIMLQFIVFGDVIYS